MVSDYGDNFQDDEGSQGFESHPGDLSHIAAQFSALDDQDIPDSLSETIDTGPPLPLENAIRKCLRDAAGQPMIKFLPKDDLERLITETNIRHQLNHVGIFDDIQQITEDILRPVPVNNRKSTTRRRIFTVLCLIKQVEAITDFIEHMIYDSDLPFNIKENDGNSTCRSGNRIPFLDVWQPFVLETFKTYQGRVTAPRFKFSTNSERPFKRYVLHECMALPFTEESFKRSPLYGGTAEVRKVKIHPAHFEHNDSLV